MPASIQYLWELHSGSNCQNQCFLYFQTRTFAVVDMITSPVNLRRGYVESNLRIQKSDSMLSKHTLKNDSLVLYPTGNKLGICTFFNTNYSHYGQTTTKIVTIILSDYETSWREQKLVSQSGRNSLILQWSQKTKIMNHVTFKSALMHDKSCSIKWVLSSDRMK